ncbi:hypothetical protein NFX39_06155 [Fructobacillus sp. W13]|uniref:Uncharacterized protein n=1 Tax=Fructobacillus apis TaxID=2935017 RepID=A0ABT0ZRP4_9LACO|nr:hypothetical protein [Fructobacillus apis]MCO0832660.1 hypothetical protein [Fructobacillus apis]
MSECVLSFTYKENKTIELKPHTKNFEYYNNLLRLNYDDALTVVKHANNPSDYANSEYYKGCENNGNNYTLKNYYGRTSLTNCLNKDKESAIADGIKTVNKSNTNLSGYEIHHDMEKEYPNLSSIANCYSIKEKLMSSGLNSDESIGKVYNFQDVPNLTYADLLEHSILHALIYDKAINDKKENYAELGIRGGNSVIGKINEYFINNAQIKAMVWNKYAPVEKILKSKAEQNSLSVIRTNILNENWSEKDRKVALSSIINTIHKTLERTLNEE